MEIGTSESGGRFLKKDFPYDEGLDAKVNKTHDVAPRVEADVSIVRSNDRKGL